MKRPIYVLGLHPSARGFGWALLNGQDTLVDFGASEVHGPDKNAIALVRVEHILDKYRPAVLALEAFDEASSRRKPRLRQLYGALIKLARDRGIVVHQYARSDIAATFGLTDTKLRHAVAAEVAVRFEVLRPRAPGPQKIWLGEHHNMGLFCAAACALTHYAAMASLKEAA